MLDETLSQIHEDERKGLPSCSELHRIIACPGYPNLKRKVKPRSGHDSSEYYNSKIANYGTAVHEAIAGELHDGMTLSERQLWTVKQCQKIKDKFMAQLFGPEPTDYYLSVESRWWLKSAKDGRLRLSGRADFVAGKEGKFLLLDWKSLPGDVDEAAKNWQLLGLAVCLTDDDQRKEFLQEIYAAIVQPSVSLNPPLVKYDIDQLLHARRQIIQSLDAADNPLAPRFPGKHCKYCPCHTECPEGQSMALVLTHPSTSIATASPDQIAELYDRLPVVLDVIESIKKRAKELALSGNLPNHEIKERRGNIEFHDLKLLRESLSEFITKEEFSQLLSIGTGDLREKFIEKYQLATQGDKIEGGRLFEKIIQPICKRGPSKQVITKKETNNE